MLDLVNQLLPILTIVAQVAIVAVVVGIVLEKKTKKQNAITEFFAANGLLIAFLVALSAVGGSLFYSEILGYEPCKLCWFQRIIIYPQVITLGIALWKKDGSAYLSSYIMSGIGIVIAGYQYLSQIAVVSEIPCAAAGAATSCSERFFLEYGYITIPMMALTGFALIIVSLAAKQLSK